ncbi:response regulator [Fusicatenibacter sp.]
MYQVLVIDDDKLARKGLISLIPWEKYGMEVAGDVANGALALQFIEMHPVDLAVVDLTMPVLSGLEFICECRARGISMDYIVLSAHEDFTYVQKALRLGVLDYISKLQLEPEECGEVFLRAAEHIRKRKEKERQIAMTGRTDREKAEILVDQEEKKQWRKLWEETASLTWVYNAEETQRLCNLRKAIPASQKQEYRYMMQTLQGIQNAFGILMEEQEYENLRDPEKLTEKIRQDLWRKVQNGEGQAVTETLILKAVLFIGNHLVDSELKAEQIADAVGMSRSYFSVCFKKCTGYSVNSYIRKERIALACRLLQENSQISAEQIADAVGYRDEKYFVKLFQQSIGISFAEYKKQLKRQDF